MKIIVFGATGNTGRELVTRAVAEGHSVTAFARHPEVLQGIAHLQTVQGDALDPAAVTDAIGGHRAVLSALGARDLKKVRLLAQALPNIVEGMRHHNVTRLIVLGAAGAQPDYGKYQNALTNMIIWVAKQTLLRNPFADQKAQEQILASSELDYTIVRAPRLTDGPFTGKYRILPDALPPGALSIARADVASFMLQQLTDPRFHRQGPYVGG
jgi:putative NADH-flavin reductase